MLELKLLNSLTMETFLMKVDFNLMSVSPQRPLECSQVGISVVEFLIDKRDSDVRVIF